MAAELIHCVLGCHKFYILFMVVGVYTLEHVECQELEFLWAGVDSYDR